MGQVWLARRDGAHGFQKLVAVKTILPALARDERVVAMFVEEARIAGRVDHPNVAAALDLFETDGLLCLVMEWVPGSTLDELKRRARARGAPLPLLALLRVVADACAGLHAIHEAKDEQGTPLGVVHGDVSPDNIVVRDDGVVKVIDFGVARRGGDAAEEPAEVLGKPTFMAPERATGRAIDRRADVFSLGAVLYDAIVGAPPLRSTIELARFADGRGELPPLPREVPDDARRLLRCALAVDPALRFESAAAMQRALEEVIAALGAVVTANDVVRALEARTRRPEPDSSPPIARSRVVVAGDWAAPIAAPDGVDVARAPLAEIPEQSAARTGAYADPCVGVFPDVEAACAAFNRGQVDAFVLEGATAEELTAAIGAACSRGPAPLRAPPSRTAKLDEEKRLRARGERYAVRLDAVRRRVAYASNEARVAVVGELEVRRARALGAPLCLVVYRMHRPKETTPAADAAIVLAALPETAMVAEEYGEIVAVAPGASAADFRARLEGCLALGAVAARDADPGEAFASLLARTRVAASGAR